MGNEMMNAANEIRWIERKIADLHIAGAKTSDIATLVKKSEATVTRVLNKDSVKKYLNQKYDSMEGDLLDKQFRRALEVRGEILEKGKEFNRLAAANAIIKERREREVKDQSITVVFGGIALGEPVSAGDNK